jgi:hypothetical protein
MLLGPRADRTVQRTRQQVVHLLAVQRADRQPGDHLVVPQIGRRTGSRGEQHLGAVVPDDLLQQPDGRVVEQVVDGVAQWVARVSCAGSNVASAPNGMSAVAAPPPGGPVWSTRAPRPAVRRSGRRKAIS